jgi:hypothetical protein
MHARNAIAVALTLLASGCRMDAEERRNVLQQARAVDQRVSSTEVVQQLRTPTNSERLIYAPPTNLSEQSAAATGAAQVWAPFGIARPDSAVKRSSPR